MYPVYTQRLSQYTHLYTNTFTRFSRTSNMSLSRFSQKWKWQGFQLRLVSVESIHRKKNGEFYSNLTAEMWPHWNQEFILCLVKTLQTGSRSGVQNDSCKNVLIQSLSHRPYMESSMATSVHFISLFNNNNQEQGGIGRQQRANCRKGSRWNTSSSLSPHSFGGNSSFQKIVSVRNSVHIKQVIYELPLDRGIYLYQEINISSGRF